MRQDLEVSAAGITFKGGFDGMVVPCGADSGRQTRVAIELKYEPRDRHAFLSKFALFHHQCPNYWPFVLVLVVRVAVQIDIGREMEEEFSRIKSFLGCSVHLSFVSTHLLVANFLQSSSSMVKFLPYICGRNSYIISYF